MTDVDEIMSIVNESGNSFHCKVTNYLREKGWHTLVSPYYMDNSTSKPREIDLIAEKSWPHQDKWGQYQGTINIKLFIECKYIPQKNVFWFDEIDIASAMQLITSNTPLRENNTYTNKYHYLSNKMVAKLFASKTKPNFENEVIYKALNQSLNAMVYLRYRESIIPPIPHRDNTILAAVELPVILCNSFNDFYQVKMDDPCNPEEINNNFQLEVNYAYLDTQKTQRSEYFLLDVVDYNKFDDFLAALEVDVDSMHVTL